jgi:hypothetical protein
MMRDLRTLSLLAALLAASAALAGCAGGGDVTPGELERDATVGMVPYDGPRTPDALKAHCDGGGYEALPCYVETLQAYQHNAGSVAAFDLLDALTLVDPAVNQQSHAISHELGKYALKVYGTIERTLAECSYKVFQGCLHGALQAYFDSLDEVRAQDYQDVCPTDTRFKEYACLHGLGHGLVLYTQYNVTRSLEMCDVLTSDFARGSCHGGAFMENMVAYMDRENAVEGIGHVHGDTSNVTFMIDPANPYYPCDAVRAEYQATCWLLQTSLMLFLNNKKGMPHDENFRQAMESCKGVVEQHREACFRSLGRDASSYANSQCGVRADACYVQAVTVWCGSGEPGARALCIRGAVAEVVLNFASPDPGLAMCRLTETVDKDPCYFEMAIQAAYMVDREALTDMCNRAEDAHRMACERGAGLRR